MTATICFLLHLKSVLNWSTVNKSHLTLTGERKEYILPDRNKYVNMERQFLDSYMRLVVGTSHARGAPATGGMAALMLQPGSDGSDDE